MTRSIEAFTKYLETVQRHCEHLDYAELDTVKNGFEKGDGEGMTAKAILRGRAQSLIREELQDGRTSALVVAVDCHLLGVYVVERVVFHTYLEPGKWYDLIPYEDLIPPKEEAQ